MKFHWFAEITYPHLPDDFPDKNRSSWVDPPIAYGDSRKIGESYHMYLRLLQQADRLGWDGLAVNEHHQTPFGMSPSPNLLAAALAVTTENAAIVIIGDSIALYNPPTRVAEEVAFLDCLTNGRIVSGLVFGTPMDSMFAYGVPPVELRDRFHEARLLILRAWKEQEPFAFNGKYNKLRYVNVWPRPIQDPPPIWVPGSGSLETWDLVVRENYCYGYLSFFGLANAKPIVNAFWEYCEEHEGNMNPHRMAFTQLVCCADSDAAAERQYMDAVKYFYTHNKFDRQYLGPPGYTTGKSLKWSLERKSTEINAKRVAAAKGELSFKELDDLGFIIAGTPETVRDRIREVATELRVGQLITAMQMGNLPEEIGMQNNELFGTKVAPYLRDIWADYGDQWTPRESQLKVLESAPQMTVPVPAS
jgi:alkanesulfonate monooxygenase SsuD/methylene tetrahydromethanopterin reductase-like flavin-dependent oxidoreductase (luciferase family)